MYAFSTGAGLMVICFARNLIDSLHYDNLAAAQRLGWLRALPIVGATLVSVKPAELSGILVEWYLFHWSPQDLGVQLGTDLDGCARRSLPQAPG